MLNSTMFLLQEISLDEEEPSDSQNSETDESDGFVDDEIEDSDLLEDIAGAIHTDGDSQPIPEPVEHPSRRLQSLLMWTLYFLIVWQYCHLISDNALLMLLRFFKAFLVCIGSIIPNGAGADLVLSLAALLPMTMYSLRNFPGH